MPGESGERRRRFLHAGIAYLGIGTAIVGLTVLTPGLTGPNRSAEIAHLLAALPFVVLFGAFVATGDRWILVVARMFGLDEDTAAGFGVGAQRVVTILLSMSALVRTIVFAANGIGWRIGITGGLTVEPAPPKPIFGLCALGTAAIFTFLVRALVGPRSPG